MLLKRLYVAIILTSLAPHTLATTPVIGEAEVKHLVEVRAVGANIGSPPYITCDEKFNKKQANDVSKYFAVGNSGAAGAAAGLLAKKIAACYLRNPKSTTPFIHISHKSLPELAEELGGALTLESIGSGDPVAAAHAKTFLEFAQQNGRTVDAMMRKLVGEGAESLPSGVSAALSTTAISIVKKRKENSFAFDQQYKSKVLQVLGKVSSVTGGAGKATVTLLGNLDRPVNGLAFADYVSCTVEQQDSLNKVTSVVKGQKVTVRGLYLSSSELGEIVLSRCELL